MKKEIEYVPVRSIPEREEQPSMILKAVEVLGNIISAGATVAMVYLVYRLSQTIL